MARAGGQVFGDACQSRKAGLKDFAPPETFPLRPPQSVMRLARMGAAFPTRLSFLPTLMRFLRDDAAEVTRGVWNIDDAGFGHAVYTVSLGGYAYSLVAVSSDIPDESKT